MDWGILLLAVTLAGLWLAEKTRPLPKKKPSMIRGEMMRLKEEARRIITQARVTNGPQRLPNSSFAVDQTRIVPVDRAWENTFSRTFSQIQTRTAKPREKAMRDEWKQSVIGLLRLSDQNLMLAKAHMTMKDFKSAIQTAGTSVENITRALIHCYGGKPDDDLGQEEVLKMLSRRFSGTERNTFDEMVQEVATIHISTRDSLQKASCSEKDAQEVTNLANLVNTGIKQIMIIHFTNEIPELDDRCSKCNSFDIQVRRSELQPTSFQCRSCLNSWTAS
jgi:hypothetical protein